MNTTQRITKTAQALGYTVSSEFGGELVARNAQGEARMSATIVDGRFHGGYTTDRMGHVVSHRTVREFIASAA